MISEGERHAKLVKYASRGNVISGDINRRHIVNRREVNREQYLDEQMPFDTHFDELYQRDMQ